MIVKERERVERKGMGEVTSESGDGVYSVL